MSQVFIDGVSDASSKIIMTNPDKDLFNQLNLSGRKKYYNQGYYGQDTIIAVIDSGCAPHVEFGNRLLKGKNFCTTGYCSDTPLDEYGHGTHVAGIIAGTNCGIAPQANILPVKVLDIFGSGKITDIINALYWCNTWKNEKGKRIDIINMSLSSNAQAFLADPKLLDDYHKAIRTVVESGIAVIVAAGNSGKEEIKYPAYFEEVITVGAVDINKKTAAFTTKSKQVDLCQVGVDVLSTYHMDSNKYVYESGTSMASPHVAGIAALLMSKAKAMGIPLRDHVDRDKSSIFGALKLNSIDVDIKGTDISTGAGFCSISPSIGKMKIQMKENDPNILVDNKIKVSDAAPITVPPGRFMVPARFMVETLGGQASYDPATKVATFEIDI